MNGQKYVILVPVFAFSNKESPLQILEEAPFRITAAGEELTIMFNVSGKLVPLLFFTVNMACLVPEVEYVTIGFAKVLELGVAPVNFQVYVVGEFVAFENN